jgi:uncharacterized protein
MFAMNAPEFISQTKSKLEILAPPKTDFFVDMVTMKVRDDAPFYFERRKGDFVMKALVRPEFKSTYDAGGLFVYESAKKWIKFEFELTDLGYPSIVSVVTNKVSDDSNGEMAGELGEIWLQVARRGDNWALHFSEDGKRWKMCRYFQLKMKEELRIGLEAQSPLGEGCRVEFAKFAISDNRLKNLRAGK